MKSFPKHTESTLSELFFFNHVNGHGYSMSMSIKPRNVSKKKGQSYILRYSRLILHPKLVIAQFNLVFCRVVFIIIIISFIVIIIIIVISKNTENLLTVRQRSYGKFKKKSLGCFSLCNRPILISKDQPVLPIIIHYVGCIR